VTDVDTAQVVSADGTAIGYRLVGAGPPLLVLHGAMQSALSQHDLALALADRFTVVLADRRGRGLSGPFGDWTLAGRWRTWRHCGPPPGRPGRSASARAR
jgi:pimeloyl-ACP methyl ester carboxylesterase